MNKGITGWMSIILIILAAIIISSCGKSPADTPASILPIAGPTQTVPTAVNTPAPTSSIGIIPPPVAAPMDGQALLQERCTVCHTLDRVTASHKTLEQWTATVNKMISNGAQLDAQEKTILINYLAQTYP